LRRWLRFRFRDFVGEILCAWSKDETTGNREIDVSQGIGATPKRVGTSRAHRVLQCPQRYHTTSHRGAG
jgi:hypothetical protein